MTKIGIFTINSFHKVHPRIQMELNILKENGFDVTLIKSPWNKEGLFFELINLLSLKYFKRRAILYFSKKIKDFDIVHVYDFQLLPLAKIAKKKGKKVIYETLDDNVNLHFYALKKKIPLFLIAKGFIINTFGRYETRVARKFCDKVIVNSPNLLLNFKMSELIFYASNLEGIQTNQFCPKKETIFLYLGKLTTDKGAKIYSELMRKHQLRLFILGKAMDNFSINLLKDKSVKFFGEFSSENLKKELKQIMNTYNVIGLSIVLPINKSYELQEANKDIDYLSMPIPFIGNKRKPTYEKITAGAGVLFSDDIGVQQLITNKNGKYDLCREEARKISKRYSHATFKERLMRIYQEISSTSEAKSQ